MRSRLGLALGAASYSIDLFHTHMLIVMGRVWGTLPVTNAAVILLVSLALSTMAGLLAYAYFEKPLMRWTKGQWLVAGRREWHPYLDDGVYG
jgi:peptidoglycan/LPS O-acetylase OafA/YrhL